MVGGDTQSLPAGAADPINSRTRQSQGRNALEIGTKLNPDTLTYTILILLYVSSSSGETEARAVDVS